MRLLERVPAAGGSFNYSEPGHARALEEFEHPGELFMQLYRQHFPASEIASRILDLGCGSATTAMRFAQAFPTSRIDGVEGASTVLARGRKQVVEAGLQGRVTLIEGVLPDVRLSRERYQLVISNGLLHNLDDPGALWKMVRQHAAANATVLVMDLRRPEAAEDAEVLARHYAADREEALRRDLYNSLYNSLLAAYRPAEVKSLLQAEGLECFQVGTAGDRHLLIWGKLEAGR
jgi:ubiquinone/menaquinone biosynthesis C-methylase UbiE